MILSPYQLTIIAGGFTLVGMLLGAWLTNHFAERRDKKNRIESSSAEAARKFRRVIAEEIAALSIKADLSRIDNIQIAIIEFKPYLSAEQKQRINEIWTKYITLENNRFVQSEIYKLTIGPSFTSEVLNEFLKFTE